MFSDDVVIRKLEKKWTAERTVHRSTKNVATNMNGHFGPEILYQESKIQKYKVAIERERILSGPLCNDDCLCQQNIRDLVETLLEGKKDI